MHIFDIPDNLNLGIFCLGIIILEPDHPSINVFIETIMGKGL